MLRIAWAQARRRWTRSAAVVLAIVVAAVSFSLLTSAVASSRLTVQGTVDENYQSAYDILVRPADSDTPLEKAHHLVQENYLGGQYGGITLAQLHQVASTAGVEVAAPIAMVGYTLAAVHVTVPVAPYLTSATDQLFALKPTWTTDRGLSSFPDRETYLYFTRRPATYGNGQTSTQTGTQIGPQITDPITGKKVAPCQWYANHQQPPTSAFDLAHRTELICTTTDPQRGSTDLVFYYQFPMLVAAIDPTQEAKLVGLDHAVTSGRYLTNSDTDYVQRVADGAVTRVPVLMATAPLTDDQLRLRLQRVQTTSDSLPSALARPDAAQWLTQQPATTVKTVTATDDSLYRRLLTLYRSDQANTLFQFFRPTPSTITNSTTNSTSSTGATSTTDATTTTSTAGDLVPRPRRPVPASTYANSYFGDYYAPQASSDVAFRGLVPHDPRVTIAGDVNISPILKAVGVFDPDRIAGFSTLSQVPLTTYYPPDAAPADQRSRRLLGGQALLPNANLTGYLQQPPTILTTIASLPMFFDHREFPDVTPAERQAPISVIRVRVAGVTGADNASRERVRLAAEHIARETGLTVDITAGSSPTPETIDLAAGNAGRPALRITEGWVQKGVSVLLLTSLDTKSLALFVLVLVVCVLFLTNATVAAVRTRRSELGVLACLGWPARRIFALLESELVITGAVAGLLGTAVATLLALTLSLTVSWWQIALITPVATLLAGLAGVWPAWRASHAIPIDAIHDPVSKPRRARNVDTVTKLAWVGVRRLPGRTILAATLFVGVAALAVLIAIQQAFQGQVTGTALGDVVAVQVRGVDYLAAAITIALGAFAVADIAYLNISERTAEIGTLRSTGWSERHLQRLFGTEAFITATLGALGGGAAGVTITALVLPVGPPAVLQGAVLAAGAGVAAAMVAVSAPLTQLQQLAPSAAIH